MGQRVIFLKKKKTIKGNLMERETAGQRRVGGAKAIQKGEGERNRREQIKKAETDPGLARDSDSWRNQVTDTSELRRVFTEAAGSRLLLFGGFAVSR